MIMRALVSAITVRRKVTRVDRLTWTRATKVCCIFFFSFLFFNSFHRSINPWGVDAIIDCASNYREMYTVWRFTGKKSHTMVRRNGCKPLSNYNSKADANKKFDPPACLTSIDAMAGAIFFGFNCDCSQVRSTKVGFSQILRQI